MSSGNGPTRVRSATTCAAPRDDLVFERIAGDGAFEQVEGPFTSYRRELTLVTSVDGTAGGRRLDIAGRCRGSPGSSPSRALGDRPPGRRADPRAHVHAVPTPWWAPPDRLDPRQLTVLGLLAAASMSSAFVNTLFTQTVAFAADDFGVGDTGVAVGGSLVRAGIVLALPFAILADRIGRRRVVTAIAVAAPLVSAAGALAPTFPALVATQTVGRLLGLALDFLIAVVAAEEMPRNSRAYAVSVLAMASGLGAGVAVLALPLADISESSWRGRSPRRPGCCVASLRRRRRRSGSPGRARADGRWSGWPPEPETWGRALRRR